MDERWRDFEFTDKARPPDTEVCAKCRQAATRTQPDAATWQLVRSASGKVFHIGVPDEKPEEGAVGEGRIVTNEATGKEVVAAPVIPVNGKDVFEQMETLDIALIQRELSGEALLRELVVHWQDEKGQDHYQLNYNGVKELARTYQEHGQGITIDRCEVFVEEVTQKDGTVVQVYNADCWATDADGMKRYGSGSRAALNRYGEWDRFARRTAASLAQRNALAACLPIAKVELFIRTAIEGGRVVSIPPPSKGRTEAVRDEPRQIERKLDPKEARERALKRFFVAWDQVMTHVRWDPTETTRDEVERQGRRALIWTVTSSQAWRDMFAGDGGAGRGSCDSFDGMSANMIEFVRTVLDRKIESFVLWMANKGYEDVLADMPMKEVADAESGPAAPHEERAQSRAVPGPREVGDDTAGANPPEAESETPTEGQGAGAEPLQERIDMLQTCLSLLDAIVLAVRLTIPDGDATGAKAELVRKGMREGILGAMRIKALSELPLADLKRFAAVLTEHDKAIVEWLQAGDYLIASRAQKMPGATAFMKARGTVRDDLPF